MNVGTNGILVDQHGNVLLIKRNDTRTYAPPGGAVDAGELPPEAAARHAPGRLRDARAGVPPIAERVEDQRRKCRSCLVSG